MKRILLQTIFLIVSLPFIAAQEQIPQSVRDTVSVEIADSLGSSDNVLVLDDYSDILYNLKGCLIASDSFDKAITLQVKKNRGRRTLGYRVRIYFDNSQNARSVSQDIADTFMAYYPDIPVFRIYDNPYFKVTVGEFYTRSDAMKFITRIRRKYPSAFLVREPFSTI